MLLIEMWRAAGCENDVGRECDQFGCIFANLFGAGRPARVDAHIMAVDPAQFPQPAEERRDAGSAFRIVRGGAHEHADAPHPLALLRARRERPCGSAADERDELAAFQLIELHSFPPAKGALQDIESQAISQRACWNFAAPTSWITLAVIRVATSLTASILRSSEPIQAPRPSATTSRPPLPRFTRWPRFWRKITNSPPSSFLSIPRFFMRWVIRFLSSVLYFALLRIAFISACIV